jgi:hypothetical protein
MSDFDKGEELHVTLIIAFEFSRALIYLLILILQIRKTLSGGGLSRYKYAGNSHKF